MFQKIAHMVYILSGLWFVIGLASLIINARLPLGDYRLLLSLALMSAGLGGMLWQFFNNN